MIITGGDIRNKRTEDIKRRAFTERLLDFHISLNLIERHMARAFHHNLHILFPGARRQLTEHNKFLDL